MNSKFRVATVFGVVAAAVLLGWAYKQASIRTSEMDCTNNLRSIGLAIENYCDLFNRYPSPNFGEHSWRIRCLPFILASPMYSEYRFDEFWDCHSK